MNKTEFTKRLARRLGKNVSFAEATRVLETILDSIIVYTRSTEKLKFRGFGTFLIKHKRPRIIRHPKTGGKLLIHEENIAKFRPSPRRWSKRY